mmetsp:Transcript_1056/g.2460  ORF Transcript_1056/g.2460 Transcript_1056/m.2460 type:complete len:672 (+) Transcript_1056:169-2184(+)|eukprot:CAMPEP_0168169732 /NCGR_PEP_ID=MMETSP0139_2-20121125/3796_1 /TAXON_ID=44445 /ORGANISM="Pseudo-nitzschia australis, Strain 10249 10 AB" /LENGTH=671 /DNA_ID=CAMNT_0008087173 /DNA_START=102 /DNA_END=2117 /DNA_ORIENTATION=-
MSVSAASEAYREEWRYDEYATLESMQPSDEWEGSRYVDDLQKNRSSIDDDDSYSAPDDEIDYQQHDDDDNSSIIDEGQDRYQQQPTSSPPTSVEEIQQESSFATPLQPNNESCVSSSFVDYFSHLTSSFSVERSKMTSYGTSCPTTATFSEADGTVAKKEKAKKSGSNHSRCIIENTESIQDRRDEHKQNGGNRGEREPEEDCTRDQSTMSCSVEEISQISELTMDIPTVATEQPHKPFGQCSPTLPTISEVPQFKSSCTAGVRNKSQCSAGTDTTTNKSQGNNDIIDFVFELVEDALCKPMKTSKSERKQVFKKAFYEESERVVKNCKKSNSNKDPFRETSKHSRKSSSTRSSRKKLPGRYSPRPDENEGSVADPMDGLATQEPSSHSTRKSSDHSRMKIVDKPPVQTTEFSTLPNEGPHDEELTMDWSKIMSLAEKQLQAEAQSVISEDSGTSTVSSNSSGELSGKVSFYTTMRSDQSYATKVEKKPRAEILIEETTPKAVIFIEEANVEALPASSGGNSSSTHASLAASVVQELRDLSALDSSSFEERSRFLLTTSLFRIVRHLIPSLTKPEEEHHEERVFDEVSENGKEAEVSTVGRKTCIGPQQETFYEGTSSKILRYVAFSLAFIFWPYGIARRSILFQPWSAKITRTDNKPASLLQLVCETDSN